MNNKKDSELEWEGHDVVQLGPEVAPGVRCAVRHRPDHTSEELYFTEAQDGAPVPPGADLVNLGPDDGSGWRPVETLYSSGETGARKAGGDGPAQVATPAYRDGYDRIFGKKAVVGQA
jgi:hypothetical protein